MFGKNISFWCVVLFFVVAMIIHHILSQNSIIEGNKNQDEDEDSGNIDMSNVKSFKFTIKGNSDAVVGMLGGKEKTLGTIGNPVVGGEETGGEETGGQTASTTTTTTSPSLTSCSGALRTPICGIQKSSETCNGYTTSNAPNGKGYRCIWNDSRNSCDSYLPGKQNERLCNLETTPGSDAGQTTTNTTSPSCSGALRTPNCGIQQSSETCNGYTTENAPNGQGYRCIWNDSRNSCDSYLPGEQKERICNLETTPGSGGGAVAGEETGGNPVVPAVSPQPTTPGMGEPIWVLAEETNKNCNEVCSSQEGNMKCLSGDWRMDLDEYKQALFDGGLKNEENVNTIEDVETWCGKITTSSGNTRPGTGNTPSRETQCFGTSNNNTDCESRHELSRRLCKCG